MLSPFTNYKNLNYRLKKAAMDFKNISEDTGNAYGIELKNYILEYAGGIEDPSDFLKEAQKLAGLPVE